MQRLIMYAKQKQEAEVIRRYLEQKSAYRVSVAESPATIEEAARSRGVQLVMLQTGFAAAQDLAYASSLRGLGYTSPILVITDSKGGLDVTQASEQRVYFLEKPFGTVALLGLIKKLMHVRGVGAQASRRYPTDLAATVETFVSSDKIDSQMLNISRGGAYFEVARKPPLGVGDLLRLRVYLVDMHRDHYVHGRVVWMAAREGGFGLGIKFLKSSDIYRNLLNR